MIVWAVQSAIAVSILIVVVLLVRRPVATLFGAHAAYALWTAPAIRAIMPPLPSISMSMPTNALSGAADYRFIVIASANGPSWTWAGMLIVAWLTGAAIYLALQLYRHHLFLARALRDGAALPINNIDYDVVATSAVEGPLATGLIHPIILVPSDFGQRFSARQQQLALLHEQLHHRRCDLWASAGALLITALLWFNPFAHLALSAFRRDMEAACDASVMRYAGEGAGSTYAETIVRCATKPVPRSLCALTSIDELKGRLTMLKLNHGRIRRTIGILFAAAVAVGGVTTASAAEDQQTQVFEKKVVLKGANGKDVLIEGEGKFSEAKCPGEKFEAGAASGDFQRKEDVKFVLCAAKGESLLAALQKAEVDVQKQADMPGANKAEILKQIRAKIAELQARG